MFVSFVELCDSFLLGIPKEDLTIDSWQCCYLLCGREAASHKLILEFLEALSSANKRINLLVLLECR